MAPTGQTLISTPSLSSIMFCFGACVDIDTRTSAGNSTATARDPARLGTTYGPLEVMADLKEPVSALKARMIEKAAESGFIAWDDKER